MFDEDNNILGQIKTEIDLIDPEDLIRASNETEKLSIAWSILTEWDNVKQ